MRIAQESEAIIREIGPERIASFSAEPVQGAGGLIIPPAHLLAGDVPHLPEARYSSACG